MSDRWRIVRLIQYGLGVIVLVWLVRGVRAELFIEHLGRLTLPIVAILGVVTLLGLGCRFYMWRALFNPIQPTRFASAVRVDLVVNFINQLLPSRISGRSVAPLVARHYTGIQWSDAVAVSGTYTALFAVLYGVVGAIGLTIIAPTMPLSIGLLVTVSIGLYLTVGILILLAGSQLQRFGEFGPWIARLGAGLPVGGERLAMIAEQFPEFTNDAARRFRSLATDPWAIAGYSAAWIGSLFLTPGLRVFVLLEAFGSSFEPAILLPFVIVAAYSVTLLPLTPGGIGITEATAAVVLSALGVPYDIVVPVVLIDRVLGVYLPAVLGWVPAVRIEFGQYLAD